MFVRRIFFVILKTIITKYRKKNIAKNKLLLVLSFSDDGLALVNVDIQRFPTKWWVESPDYVLFRATVINQGVSILPNLTAHNYRLVQYFSVNESLETDGDVLLPVYMLPSQHEYDHRKGIAKGQLITTGILKGEVSRRSSYTCTNPFIPLRDTQKIKTNLLISSS